MHTMQNMKKKIIHYKFLECKSSLSTPKTFKSSRLIKYIFFKSTPQVHSQYGRQSIFMLNQIQSCVYRHEHHPDEETTSPVFIALHQAKPQKFFDGSADLHHC